MSVVFITGGAGFIGSNVADAALDRGDEVVIYDNLRTGRSEFTAAAQARGARFVRGDLGDQVSLNAAMAGSDLVVHLAANADVRRGLDHPRRDLEQNTIATANVLEAMRETGVRRIAFSSTGSVYGEPDVFPTPEDAPFPIQTSLYAASKLAGEAMISAYATGYGLSAVIFRFVSILGERYTHGHVFDFWRSLRADPSRLTILGDGQQQKSYLYVGDCVDAIFRAIDEHSDDVGPVIYNLGTDETVVVDDSAALICAELGVQPAVEHTGGRRGWVGDSPLIHLDCGKIRRLGWAPKLSIADGIRATVQWLSDNPYVLDEPTIRPADLPARPGTRKGIETL